MRETERMLKDYRLATAEILYHMPDHPHLLQSFVWQDYDIAPVFPVLNRFLDFWAYNLWRDHAFGQSGGDISDTPGAHALWCHLS